MLSILARYYYIVIAMIRRSIGNIKVLTVIAYFPDLPPLDNDSLTFIERLTSTTPNLEHGSLSHYVDDQSRGKVSLRNSKLINLGNVFPLWSDTYDEPEIEGHAPVEKVPLNYKSSFLEGLGRQLLRYDVIMLFTNGIHPQNATTGTQTVQIKEQYFRSHYLSFPVTIPIVTIGLPVVESRNISTYCHELFHAFQHYYINDSDHAPYVEGEESKNISTQRNRWHILGSQDAWGTLDSAEHQLGVGVGAYNSSRFGWYKKSEELTIDTPATNKIVQLRTTNIPNPNPPESSVFICHIDTSNFPNHPDGYVIEARARRGYDANLLKSGVLIHKLDYLTRHLNHGSIAFLLGPYPQPPVGPVTNQAWEEFVFEAGEVFERPGIRIEVTNAISGLDGVPELFELDITVQ